MTSLDPFDTAPDAAVDADSAADAGDTNSASAVEPAPVEPAPDATSAEPAPSYDEPPSGEAAAEAGDGDVTPESESSTANAPLLQPEPTVTPINETTETGPATAETGPATTETGPATAGSTQAELNEVEPTVTDSSEPELTETEPTHAESEPVVAEVEPAEAPPEREPSTSESAEAPAGEVELSGDEELVAVEDVERAPAVASPFDRPGEWFVVHTYSGYENKVKNNLASRVRSMGVEERIHEVVIPMEDVIEFKAGRKTVVQKKVLPGYLLVRMDLDDNSWYVVRNTPGVTGFVGSGAKPTPLSRQEVEDTLGVEQLEGEKVEKKARPRLEFEVGDQVRVTQGNAFAEMDGTIAEIDEDRARLKVLVNIFGRETPVELAFHEVSKV